MAIYLNRFFADYFVNEARKNFQALDPVEEVKLLIGNHKKTETSSYYGGVFLFKADLDNFA